MSEKLHLLTAQRLRTVADLIGEFRPESIVVQDTVVKPGLGLLNQASLLNHRADMLEQGVCHAVAIGTVSRGKSTILNACIGKEVFPTGSEAVTGGICRLVYGGNPGTVTLVETTKETGPDGQHSMHSKTRTVSYEEFREFITLSADELSSGLEQKPLPVRLKNLRYAELQSARPLLAQGFSLVDTLGFNAGPDATQITRQFLQTAEMIILVLTPRPLLTAEDEELIRAYHFEIRKGRGNMFFVVNDFGDITPTLRSELEEKTARQRLGHLFIDESGQFDEAHFKERLHIVNPAAYLEAIKHGEAADTLEETGIPSLQRALTNVAKSSECLEYAVEAAVRQTLLPAYSDALGSITRQIGLLGLTSEELQEAAHNADAGFTKLRLKFDPLRKEMETIGQRMGENAANHFRSHFLGIFKPESMVTVRGQYHTHQWTTDWERLKMLDILGTFTVIRGAFSKSRREEIANAMKMRLEVYFQELGDAWCMSLTEKLKANTLEVQKLVRAGAMDFALGLEDIRKLVPLDSFQVSPDMSERRALKTAQSILGLMMLDPNQVVGPWIDAGIGAFLLRLIGQLVAYFISGSVAFLLGSLAGGPVGWIAGIVIFIAELWAVHKGDRALMNRRLRNKMGSAIYDELARKMPEVQSGIRQQIAQQVSNLSDRFHEAMEREMDAQKHEIDAALRAVNEGRDREEKARLETLRNALDAQFAEISQELYGRVLTPKECEERALSTEADT